MIANPTNVAIAPNTYAIVEHVKSNLESRQNCYSYIGAVKEMCDSLPRDVKLGIERGECGELRLGVEFAEPEFSFDGVVFVYLQTPLIFTFDDRTRKFVNSRWGCESETYSGISKCLARRFSILSHKAHMSILSDAESEYWRNIISDIDYRRYAYDVMPSMYIEVKVEAVKPHRVTVRGLLDNKLRNIVGDAVRLCQNWAKKDLIGMKIKLNSSGDVVFIEQPCLLDMKDYQFV